MVLTSVDYSVRTVCSSSYWYKDYPGLGSRSIFYPDSSVGKHLHIRRRRQDTNSNLTSNVSSIETLARASSQTHLSPWFLLYHRVKRLPITCDINLIGQNKCHGCKRCCFVLAQRALAVFLRVCQRVRNEAGRWAYRAIRSRRPK